MSETPSNLQELEDGPLYQSNLDAGSSKIIPVPSPLGGVIVVGESVLTYINTPQQMRSTQIKPNTPIQVCMQLPDSSTVTCTHCAG